MNVTLDLLAAYSWPGNVRELRNMIHSLVITLNWPLISPGDLPMQVHRHECDPSPIASLAAQPPLKEVVSEIERDLITRAFEIHGSVQKVARLFRVNRSAIFRKQRLKDR